jgi:hypothetical protein
MLAVGHRGTCSSAQLVPIGRTDPASRVIREALTPPLVAVTVWYGTEHRVIVDEGLTELQAAYVVQHASAQHGPPESLRDESFTVWDCVCGACLWADAWVALLAITQEMMASSA